MAYTSEAILRAQSPFKNSTNIDTTYITRKITEADNIINASIGELYVLPLSSTPGIIASLSEAIAICLLFKEQDSNIEVQPGIDVEEIWKAQMDILNSIRTKKLKLFDTDGNLLTMRSSSRMGFYPTQASSDAQDITSTAPKFSMNDTF